MSCGHCGTDDKNEEGKKCMACECPCEEHKEHTHGDEGEKHGHDHEEKPSGVCESCTHAHNDDGHCDCGCA